MHRIKCFRGSFIRSWGSMSEKNYSCLCCDQNTRMTYLQKKMESIEILRSIIMKRAYQLNIGIVEHGNILVCRRMIPMFSRYANADSKISLYVYVHTETIPWKFCILKPFPTDNSREYKMKTNPNKLILEHKKKTRDLKWC